MERFQDKWKMELLQFCKEEFYESFRAPKWMDLLDLDRQLQPDDTTWFCTLAGCDQNHVCFEEMLEQTFSLKDPSFSSANGFNKSTQKAKTASSKSRKKSPSSNSSTKEKFRTPMKTGSQIRSSRKCLKSPENENPNHSSNLNVPNPEATPLKDSVGDSQNPSDSPANLLNTTTSSSKSRKALSTPKTRTLAPSPTETKAPRCMKDELPWTKKCQRNTNNHSKDGNGQLKTPLTVPVKKGFCESKTAQVKERALLKGSSRCPLNASSSASFAEANMKGPSPSRKLNFAGLDGGNKTCPQTKDQGRNDEFKQEDVDKRHSNHEIDMQKLELAEELEQDAWKENIVAVETFTDSPADLRTEENVQVISGRCNEVKSLQQGEGIEASSERPIICHGMGKDFENVKLMEGKKADYWATNLSENLNDKDLNACDCVTVETKDPKKLVKQEILKSTTANSQSQLIKTDQFSVDEFSVSDSSKHLLDASDADIPNSTTPHKGKSCTGMENSDKRNKGKERANQLEGYEGKIDEPEGEYEKQSFQDKKLPQPKPNETLTHGISTITHATNPRSYDVSLECDKMVKGCQQPNYGSRVQKSGYGMSSPVRCSKEKLSRADGNGSSTKKSISKMTTQSSPNEMRKKTNITCPKPFRFRTEERGLAKEANLKATAISQTPTHLPQSKSPSKLKMSKEKLAKAEPSPSKSKTLGSLSKGPLSHYQQRISGSPKFYAKMKMDKLRSSAPVHPNHGATPFPKDQTSSAHHQSNTPFSHSHFPPLRSTHKITSPKKPNMHPEHTKDCIERAGQ